MKVRQPQTFGARLGKRRLTFEPLESRRLLDGETDGTPVPPPPPPPAQIAKFGSTTELEAFLVKDALERYQGLFGQPGWPYWWWYREGGPVLGDTDGDGVPGHSDTNVQVAGVDEGDLVETDGDFLYVLSNQQLVIIDALPAAEMEVTSRVHFEGMPFAEYLMGDRLTVLSHSYTDGGVPWWGIPGWPLVDVASPYFYRTELVVTVFDVADRAAPTIVQETRLDASHVDSRAIGNLVYLVTSSGFGLPAPELHCTPPFDPAGTKPIDPDAKCVYETEAEYLARIEGQVIELGMPHYASRGHDGVPVTGLLTSPEEVYRPIVEDAWNLLSIVVIDTSDDETPGPAFATSVPTDYASQIYASLDHLYVANPVWRPELPDGTATLLLKFDLDAVGKRVDLIAAGDVPGRLLNQFSIDEYNGYLRLATTRGWGPSTENRVLVLDQSDQSLDVVGQSEILGAGEQIFAVRFQGDRGYVVTFLRIDPLFALDLSDPLNPQRAGELEIPGFSNYLHPVAGTHLIGIGRNADATGRVEELQVSLFDVSDLSQPALTDRDSVDTALWAYSEATDNHHAVGYYPELGVLAIPVSSYEWSLLDRDGDGAGETSIYRPRTELWVWRIDTTTEGEGAVEPLGRIEHDSYVRRSVRIGDTLYSLSDVEVKAHQILNPSVELGALYYGQDDVGIGVFEPSPDDADVRQAIDFPDISAPQVIAVAVGNSEWDGAYVDLLESQSGEPASSAVGVAGVNQIKITFSEDAQVSPSDLVITGKNGATYPWYGFDYDAQIATATWTIAQIGAEELTLALADAVSDLARTRLDGDSDGQAGGAFIAQFSLLPGDVDRSGAVDVEDLNAVRNGFGEDGVGLPGDVNADGQINIHDLNVVRNNFGDAAAAVATGGDDASRSAQRVARRMFGTEFGGRPSAGAAGDASASRVRATDVLFASGWATAETLDSSPGSLHQRYKRADASVRFVVPHLVL